MERQLDELAQYATRSSFSQLFCRLLITWTREAGPDAGALGDACGRFLDLELWYHQALADLSQREAVSYEDLRSLADKRRINLTGLAERIQDVPITSPRASVVQHLLQAECHFQLQEPQRVISELEAAIEGGGGHPYVHFALGYNRFDTAREMYATAQEADEYQASELIGEFREACLAAVDAFRDGLTGQSFDAWLHYYMGRALAAAGQVDEASAALETAASIDSSIFGQPSIVDEPDAASEDQPAHETSGRASITDDEVDEFGKMLRGSWRPEDLLEGGR